MVEFELIETVKIGGKYREALFLIADKAKLCNKKIAVYGTGRIASLISFYLKSQNIDVELYVNNDKRLWDKDCYFEKPISSPNVLWNGNYYVIIAMDEIKFSNEVLWQFKMKKFYEYAYTFREKFYDFNSNLAVRRNVIGSINRLLCDGKEIQEIMYPHWNVGPNEEPSFFRLKEFCWSTTWSHYIYEWFYEKYHDGKEQKKMLEIGPGLGMFTTFVKNITNSLDITWVMFSEQNNDTEAILLEDAPYPQNEVMQYRGVIEDPKFVINDKFDVIVFTEVFEHFCVNPTITLKKIVDMLNDDGEIYLSTPNWGHVFIYDSYKDMPEYTTRDEYHELYAGHTYQYDKQELYEIFDECGLGVIRYELAVSNGHNVILKKKL